MSKAVKITLPNGQEIRVQHLKICPFHKGDLSSKIEIPVWRPDVEGWGTELVTCPVCNGKGALDAEDWQNVLDKLRGGQDV